MVTLSTGEVDVLADHVVGRGSYTSVVTRRLRRRVRREPGRDRPRRARHRGDGARLRPAGVRGGHPDRDRRGTALRRGGGRPQRPVLGRRSRAARSPSSPGGPTAPATSRRSVAAWRSSCATRSAGCRPVVATRSPSSRDRTRTAPWPWPATGSCSRRTGGSGRHDYREQMLGDRRYVTDGGLETDLIFHHGAELPEFAAFPLVEQAQGRELLARLLRRLRRHRPAGRGRPDARGPDVAGQPRLG